MNESSPVNVLSAGVNACLAGQAIPQCAVSSRPSIEATIKVEAMANFSQALYHMKDSAKATRAGWDGKGLVVTAQWPNDRSKMGRPYLYMETAEGIKTPWVPSQGDLFADDWALLPRSF